MTWGIAADAVTVGRACSDPHGSAGAGFRRVGMNGVEAGRVARERAAVRRSRSWGVAGGQAASGETGSSSASRAGRLNYNAARIVPRSGPCSCWCVKVGVTVERVCAGPVGGGTEFRSSVHRCCGRPHALEDSKPPAPIEQERARRDVAKSSTRRSFPIPRQWQRFFITERCRTDAAVSPLV